MEHMSNIFSTSFGINFAKNLVWLALISLTAKINSLLFWATLYSFVFQVLLVAYSRDTWTDFYGQYIDRRVSGKNVPFRIPKTTLNFWTPFSQKKLPFWDRLWQDLVTLLLYQAIFLRPTFANLAASRV